MKIVKVTYTVKPEFAEQNSANINVVMNELRKLNSSGINYTACLSTDGKTFVHTAFFNADADQNQLSELASFKNFQEQLKNSGPEAPPKQELLSLVGASKNVF